MIASLDNIELYGYYGFSKKHICILLELSASEEENLLKKFDDPNSDVSRAYEKGKVLSKKEALEKLANLTEDSQTAIDAMKEIGKIKYHEKIDDLKNDLFGV